MGEFSPSDMPEPDFSADVPDLDPSVDIPDEAPPEPEPTPQIIPESEPPEPSMEKMETETEASFGVSETESVAESLSESEAESSTGPLPEPESSPEIALEPEPTPEVLPASEMEPAPDVPLEAESSLEISQDAERSPEPIGEPRYYDQGQGEFVVGPEQTELYHSPEMTKEIEPGVGPNPSWDEPPDETVDEVGDHEREDSPPSENADMGEQNISETLENPTPDAGLEMPSEAEPSPEIVDSEPASEEIGLREEGMPEEPVSAAPDDAAGHAQQNQTPKLYLDGEELKLPGEGEREYRIGSPHQDFEDYKKIVEADRQHDLAMAAQTSDSLGEAVGTLAEASQGDIDFTQIDEYFYGKEGHAPYTDAAYPQSEDSPTSPSISGEADAAMVSMISESGDSSSADSPTPPMPADLAHIKDSQQRDIAIRRWGDEALIQLRAYDTELGAVPENPNPGTAGMANLHVETAADGSTQVKLQDIIIPPDYRKSGIAGNMLDQTLDIARASGAIEVYGVIENEEAFNYWKHMEEKGTGWKVDSSEGTGAYGYVRYDMSSEGVKKK